MTTAAWMNKVANVGTEQKVDYQVDTTGSNDVNQGSLVYLDTSAHQVKEIGSDANCQYVVGVAADSSYVNLYGTKKYPNSGTIQVEIAGKFRFHTTAADTIYDGSPMYIGADAQTLTSTKGGNSYPVGIAKMRPGVTSVTGAAGVDVDVLIQPRYPASSAVA